jgi:dienelactone hydrolase
MADPTPFDQFIRARAANLRENDVSPKARAEWDARRKALREHIAAAIGPVPETACDLSPRVLGTIERDGYKIEKLVLQTRPDVWMTASAYVPAVKDGQKVPGVLVVHGHWAWARRDPTVQARCLGLVKLGFFVLAVDAFGSGERYTNPARGTYHGSLYGSTLWPTGYTLLGMQVYDNRRAVDYLLSRTEVNGKLGITGASGGGNQSMYAGALDERFAAVVPVCSVGNYQSYLKTACCVCEVLPNALTFTEEGDVLGLVAPRALMVVNATKDGIQFSPAEAEKSLARAKDIFTLHDAAANVKHVVFESGHDYNRPMREAMYGWMTLHLKGEGKGEPIPEPEHTVEKVEDLACFPNPADRPKGFLTPPLFAAVVGKELVAKADKKLPDHKEMWEATAEQMRADLKRILGPMPDPSAAKIEEVESTSNEGLVHEKHHLTVEPGIVLKTDNQYRGSGRGQATVVVSMKPSDEKVETSTFPSGALYYHRLPLRAVGTAAAKVGGIAGAPDHNPAEYGVWTGRPMLGQWTADVLALLHTTDSERVPKVCVGVGPAALPTLLAAAHDLRGVKAVVLVDPMVSLVTDTPYGSGTMMGLLAPGLLKVGDVPHLAALVAPKRLVIAGGVSPQGKKLTKKELEVAFRFTIGVYEAMKMGEWLTIEAEPDWKRIEL